VTMQRNVPPFRADHVGSLLRAPELKEARARRERGEITDAELKIIEDRAIEALIGKQAEIGLRSATDGEFRRSMWHFDFLERLDGCEPYTPATGIAFKGTATKAKGVRVVGKLGFTDHPMIEHFRFLRDHVKRATPKMTIPSPSVLHFRGGRKAISETVYPDLADFYRDLGQAYNRAVHAFAEAGCRYLQLDETNLAYLCDPAQRQAVRDRGENPDTLPEIYAKMINAAIAGRPADMTITMHLCRGNFQSSWIAQGGYEPVAELLFNGIGVDGYFMEYDSDRAIKRRIEQASRFLDADQLCLSPQCGFASTEEGNLLTHDQQWAKLSRIVEIAGEVWA